MSNRLQINDTKAGMNDIDREKINSIIMKNTLNSKYYQNQKNKELENKKKIDLKLKNFASLSQIDINRAQNDAASYCAKLILDTTRVLVHIDMDAFYANVEMRDNPNLKDKPIAVGSESMLSTSNYMARKYGVRAAMPGFIAKQLCPELIIVPCNFEKYHQESRYIMDLISNYDPNYKAMSLDEAYLDLTDYIVKRQTLNASERTFPREYNSTVETITFGTDIEECVRELRHRIYLTTSGLTASSGIACNLRLAKLCSDVNKPNGQYRLNNDEIIDFIRKIPIRKFNGIGPSMAQILEAYGIKSCQDLYEKRAMIKLLETQNTFEFLMHVCMGISTNVIEHNDVRKSIGHETTFSNIQEKQDLYDICSELSECVSEDLKHENIEAKKVILKIKNSKFEVFTRTHNLKRYTNDRHAIFEASKILLDNELKKAHDSELQLRLIGIRVSDLSVTKRTNTLERFLSSKRRLSIDDDDDQEMNFDLMEWFFLNCPICNEPIEGNQDFIEIHRDNCFLNFNNFERS